MKKHAGGVGVSLRSEHYDLIQQTTRHVDWLESQPENFMGPVGGRVKKTLDFVAERYYFGLHGVALSIGGPDPFSEDYFAPLDVLCKRLQPEYFSEHCCYSSALGQVYHDLIPMPFTEEAVKHIAARCRWVEDRLDLPFVLENISYYCQMPGAEMSEGEFLTAIMETADVGMLLDVNNVYVNAINHGVPPSVLLRQMPLHRVKQIHLANHKQEGDTLIDDHGGYVIEPVMDLYREAIELCGPVPTLLEWESNVPSLDRLLDEADTIRAVQNETVRTMRERELAEEAKLRQRVA